MSSTVALLAIYCSLIVVASVVGGHLPHLLRMTHLRTQLLMSSVGGLMLGIALLHLLPHASELLGSPMQMGAGALGGLIAMFLMIRLFHTHEHGVPIEADSESAHRDCGHVHHHGHEHSGGNLRGTSWGGLFFGLALHTLVDGVALASAVMAGAHHGEWLGLAGLGTFLAIVLHKPLDAFAITSVMNRQRWSPTAQSIASLLFSLACPIGAALFYFGTEALTEGAAALGWGLAISAGFFIGIALADLLPEVAFHDHDRLKLTTALLVGVAAAVLIENLPGHTHDGHGHEVPLHGSRGIHEDRID